MQLNQMKKITIAKLPEDDGTHGTFAGFRKHRLRVIKAAIPRGYEFVSIEIVTEFQEKKTFRTRSLAAVERADDMIPNRPGRVSQKQISSNVATLYVRPKCKTGGRR